MFFELRGIVIRQVFDGREIFFQPVAVQAGLPEILRGADEGARFATHRFAQRREAATGIRRQEDSASSASGGTMTKTPSS